MTRLCQGSHLRQGFGGHAAGQGEALYQLEEGLGGEVFVCLGGERLVEVPAAMAGTIAEAVERIEGSRGRQIALRWFALGVAAADPAGGAPSPFRACGAPSLSPRGEGQEAGAGS